MFDKLPAAAFLFALSSARIAFVQNILRDAQDVSRCSLSLFSICAQEHRDSGLKFALHNHALETSSRTREWQNKSFLREVALQTKSFLCSKKFNSIYSSLPPLIERRLVNMNAKG
jgi:hypothetical protein